MKDLEEWEEIKGINRESSLPIIVFTFEDKPDIEMRAHVYKCALCGRESVGLITGGNYWACNWCGGINHSSRRTIHQDV